MLNTILSDKDMSLKQCAVHCLSLGNAVDAIKYN